jgi:predicted dehydrogenase
MSGRLRVGFLGLGRIFDLHLLGYRDDPGVEIAALCAPDAAALAARGAEHPRAARHTRLDAFLGEGLDVVEVLTPHPFHAEHVLAALGRGAHVSVQKPMALSLEDADRMLAAAAAARRHLRVYENYLFYPPLVRARELLLAGAIGRPLHFRMRTVAGDPRFGWTVPEGTWQWRADLFRERRLGRLTFDDGHHKLAVALWLFGAVRDVFARIEETPTPRGPIDAPASITWRHADPPVHGIWDVVYAPAMRIDSRYYALDERFEITGETGVIQVTRATGHMLQGPPLTLVRDGMATEHHAVESDWGVSFREATRHFLGVVRAGGAPALDGSGGRRVLELGLAVRDSAVRGAPVCLG